MILILAFAKLQITTGPLENSKSREFGNLKKPKIYRVKKMEMQRQKSELHDAA